MKCLYEVLFLHTADKTVWSRDCWYWAPWCVWQTRNSSLMWNTLCVSNLPDKVNPVSTFTLCRLFSNHCASRSRRCCCCSTPIWSLLHLLLLSHSNLDHLLSYQKHTGAARRACWVGVIKPGYTIHSCDCLGLKANRKIKHLTYYGIEALWHKKLLPTIFMPRPFEQYLRYNMCRRKEKGLEKL